MAEDDDHYKLLLEDFMKFTLSTDPMLEALKHFRCQLVWGQLQAAFPHLSKCLIEVYCAPASSSAVERNHKTGKAVMSQQRCRLSDLGYQRQVSVAYNGSQLIRKLKNTRGHGFEKYMLTSCEDPSVSIPSDHSSEDSSDCSEDEEETLKLSSSICDVETPEMIPDDLIFIDLDD